MQPRSLGKHLWFINLNFKANINHYIRKTILSETYLLLIFFFQNVILDVYILCIPLSTSINNFKTYIW